MSKLSWLAVIALVGPFSSGCGGCPWTKLSDLVVTPDTPCLDIHLADSSGTGPSTGCVDPVIYGQNNCSDALVIEGTTNGEQTFNPGDSFVIEVPLETSTPDHGDDFVIVASLGTDLVQISFHASGGTDGS
jgi:hypothetical protein